MFLLHFCHNYFYSPCNVDKMIRSESMGLDKHSHMILDTLLTRLLRLQGAGKICISFADKYISSDIFCLIQVN